MYTHSAPSPSTFRTLIWMKSCPRQTRPSEPGPRGESRLGVKLLFSFCSKASAFCRPLLSGSGSTCRPLLGSVFFFFLIWVLHGFALPMAEAAAGLAEMAGPAKERAACTLEGEHRHTWNLLFRWMAQGTVCHPKHAIPCTDESTSPHSHKHQRPDSCSLRNFVDLGSVRLRRRAVYAWPLQ